MEAKDILCLLQFSSHSTRKDLSNKHFTKVDEMISLSRSR
jgi:hypothetical protein